MFPHQKPVCIYLLPHACYVRRPSNLLLFDHLHTIWEAVRAVQILTVPVPRRRRVSYLITKCTERNPAPVAKGSSPEGLVILWGQKTKRVNHRSLSWTMWIQSRPSHPVSARYTLILLFPPCLAVPSGTVPFLQAVKPKSCTNYIFFHMHATCLVLVFLRIIRSL